MGAAVVDELRARLTRAADPTKAAPMTAYMKGHFKFLGVTAPARREASREFLNATRHASAADVLDIIDACWQQPEREFQYVATDLLVRRVKALDASDLQEIEPFIRTKAWWDTVDALASNVVGPLVAAHPDLGDAMDEWIDDHDMWIARTATLHQLKFRDRTDEQRLFRYVDRRCDSTEFFMRKAQGWALREYAKTDPDAVREYVADRGDRLSGLTRREALKHL